MENISLIFGQRIRTQRKKLGLSQEQLAELCDLYPTYIGQLERGEKNASLENIMRVCKGLNTASAQLFENIHIGEETSVADEIYEILLQFTDEEQKTLLEMMKNIKKLVGH